MTITARHALITGGSRGIGRGIALKLADHGVHIAINYVRDETAAKRTLEQVRERGADGFIVQADVADPAQIEKMASGRAMNSAPWTFSCPTPVLRSRRSMSRQ